MTQSLQRTFTQAERLRDFEHLCTEMDRLTQAVAGGLKSEGAWLPEADIIETNSAFVVEVELPGVWHKTSTSRYGNELVVTGEVKQREREGWFRRRTRKVGEFEFRAVLPGDLREDQVEASLAYGVLRVYVPKAKTSKTHKISVSESNEAPS